MEARDGDLERRRAPLGAVAAGLVALVVLGAAAASGDAPGTSVAPAAARTPASGTLPYPSSTVEAATTPAPQESGVEATAFLAGCWEARQASGATVEEHWTAPRGGVMLGLSRSVRDGAARGWEHLLLSVKEERLTYTALPSGQAETDFAVAEAEEGRVVFQKPDHDFPRKLEYRAVGADSLHALVYGEVDATEPAFGLAYGRVDCRAAMGGGPGAD